MTPMAGSNTDGFGVPPELLGFWRDPQWRDMSDYVVHFTDDVDTLVAILKEGQVRPSGPFGWARNIAQVADQHRSACFSEIPLDLIDRLVKRHGRYGLGFRKDFLKSNGGARVWYLDADGHPSRALYERVRDLLHTQDFTDQLWTLTPFIDLVIPGRYDFDWEREWRVPGELSFNLSDVALVVTPDGDRPVFEQYPSLDAAFVRPGGDDAWWSAIPQVLGDAVDQMVAEYLTTFNDPVHHLSWAEGGYVWIVQEWTTDDAVMELFGDLESSVHEQIVDYLDTISYVWVKVADLESIRD